MGGAEAHGPGVHTQIHYQGIYANAPGNGTEGLLWQRLQCPGDPSVPITPPSALEFAFLTN